MTLYESIESRIREFWLNYTRLEFLNVALGEGKTRSAYSDVCHLFSMYIQVRFSLIFLAWIPLEGNV